MSHVIHRALQNHASTAPYLCGFAAFFLFGQISKSYPWLSLFLQDNTMETATSSEDDDEEEAMDAPGAAPQPGPSGNPARQLEVREREIYKFDFG